MSRETAIAIATQAPNTQTQPAQAQESGKAMDQGESGEMTKAPPSADELTSSRIAIIAKKEAKFREEQEKYKTELAEFHKKKTEFEPFYKRYQEFEEMRKKDPVAAIKMLEFSDTDFINYVSAQEDKSTPEERATKIAEAKIAEFKKELELKESESIKKRNDQTIDNFKKNIDTTLKAKSDDFEFCNFYGQTAQDLIFATVDQAYQDDFKTNPAAEPMSIMEAAKLVEDYYEGEFKKMGSLKKAQGGKVEETKAPDPKNDEPLKARIVDVPPSKTLSNKLAAPAATGTNKETYEQKKARLAEKLRKGIF